MHFELIDHKPGGNMKLQEYTHALKDGLGKENAALFKLLFFGNDRKAVIAYSKDKKLLYLLKLGRDIPGLTGDQFLETAKIINKELGCFVVPDQHPTPWLQLWGAKTETEGPVNVYQFRVIAEPDETLLKHCSCPPVVM